MALQGRPLLGPASLLISDKEITKLVKKLIEDMNRALDANCYYAALALTLMLPDICGKAEYPTLKSGERYKLWYNTYIGQYLEDSESKNAPSEEKAPYLSSEVVYSLRNSFLHQGTPNIDTSRISEPQNKMTDFALIIEQKKSQVYIAIWWNMVT